MDINTITTIVVIGLMVVFLATGMPVAVALGLSGMTGLFLLQGMVGLDTAGSLAWHTVHNFVLLAAPLFILMGSFLTEGKIASQLYDMARAWVGHFRGGLAVATILAGSIFGAVCGVSVAAAGALGIVSIPQMLKRGYDVKLTTGTVCAAGSLSQLIPPSGAMVILGAVTEISVGKLFMGGIIPGLILAGIFAIWVFIYATLDPAAGPPGVAASWKERFVSLKYTWAAIFLIVVVLGGIYAGVMTPTEAAGGGAIGAALIALLNGNLKWKTLKTSLIGTVRANCMIMFIISSAMIFARVLTLLQIPQNLASSIVSLQVSPWVIIIAINIFLIVIGCFLDVVSIIVLTAPIIFPIIERLGFDPLWFGIIVIINMEMAVLTPPVGLNLFMVKTISPPGVTLNDVMKGSLPFVACDTLLMIVCLVFPALITWLPNMMVKG